MSAAYIKDSKGTYTVFYNNKSYILNKEFEKYDEAVNCIKVNDYDSFVKLFDVAKVITEWSDGNFKVINGVLMYQELEVVKDISDRMLEMIKEGFDHKPMMRFIENLYLNPSFRAINELYLFLQNKNLPITSDGHFLAYKAVTSEFKDKYSGRIDNSIGQKPKVDRRLVDDDYNVDCSNGLHAGSIDYVKDFAKSSDKIVVVKINPANVVSVPSYAGHTKLRCCEYEVIGLYEGDLNRSVQDTHKVDDVYSSDDYDDDDDEDYDDDDDDDLCYECGFYECICDDDWDDDDDEDDDEDEDDYL